MPGNMEQAHDYFGAAPKVPAISGAGGLFPDFATQVRAVPPSDTARLRAEFPIKPLQHQTVAPWSKSRPHGAGVSSVPSWQRNHQSEAKKAGLCLRPRGRGVSPRPESRTLQMVLLAQSKSQAEVARCMRVSKQAVNRAIKRWRNDPWVMRISMLRIVNASRAGAGKSHLLRWLVLELVEP
jgi:hypothetical protein